MTTDKRRKTVPAEETAYKQARGRRERRRRGRGREGRRGRGARGRRRKRIWAGGTAEHHQAMMFCLCDAPLHPELLEGKAVALISRSQWQRRAWHRVDISVSNCRMRECRRVLCSVQCRG